MPTHLDHMEHVLHGTTMNSNNIAVDRSAHGPNDTQLSVCYVKYYNRLHVHL